jgi:hypothetical protein
MDDSTRRRTVLLLGGSLLLAGVIAYQTFRMWHRCRNEDATAILVKLIPRDPDGDGVFIIGARLSEGQLFAYPYQCEADTMPIRGNVDLSKKARRHLRYIVSMVGGVRHVILLKP